MAALILAVVVVAILLLGTGGGGYKVYAVFQNASQLVKGDQVQVSGVPMGSVTGIDVTPDGQAKLTLELHKPYTPLHRGVEATIRQASLSGVANRYVDLRLPPAGTPEIPNGGTIDTSHTTTAVDLDQIFDFFGPRERKALSQVIRGSGAQIAGRSKAANRGLLYLNPSIAASSRLFSELTRDTPALERFITASSGLVTDVAERRDQLAGLVRDLAATTSAIGARRNELADAVQALPPFMRRANTTFVNLRSALDDLQPLVDESKPVARRLRPFLAELSRLTREARPTVASLATLIRSPSHRDDLVSLTETQPALRDIAIGPVERNGASREGAFPASARSLASATPELASARPYSVDLIAWFDDFSHSGIYDALGGASRVAINANAFANIDGVLQPVPPALRGALFHAGASLHNDNICPGNAERHAADGSNPWIPPTVNCDPSQVPPGS